MIEHPDRLTLERFSAGDLPSTSTATAEHLRLCASCSGYLAELRADRVDRLAAHPPTSFVATLAQRRSAAGRRTRFQAAAVAAVSLAASVVAVIAVRGERSPSPVVATQTTQFKSGAVPGVIVHRQRGQTVRVMSETDGLRAGDALRVELVLPRPGRVSAWLDDGAVRLSLVAGEGGLLLPAGPQALPGSATIQTPCLDLTLVVQCDQTTIRRKLKCE